MIQRFTARLFVPPFSCSPVCPGRRRPRRSPIPTSSRRASRRPTGRGQYGGYDNPTELARVNRIGYELAQQSDFQKFPFTFGLVDMPVPNAFALPGGQIFVTRGMLDLGLDDDMLAALLGHEIGHVTLEHYKRMQRKATLLNVLGNLLVVGVMLGRPRQPAHRGRSPLRSAGRLRPRPTGAGRRGGQRDPRRAAAPQLQPRPRGRVGRRGAAPGRAGRLRPGRRPTGLGADEQPGAAAPRSSATCRPTRSRPGAQPRRRRRARRPGRCSRAGRRLPAAHPGGADRRRSGDPRPERRRGADRGRLGRAGSLPGPEEEIGFVKAAALAAWPQGKSWPTTCAWNGCTACATPS